jgi:ERCC4-type nuclease
MNSKEILICDTREKKNKSILKYFDKNNIDYITSKLEYGDYKIYKDNSVVIDRKDSLLEIAHNLCSTLEHERIKAEIQRAKDDGCKEFIFLIAESKIKSINDITKWSSPHTKVKGSTLLKTMVTMKNKYDVRFIICPRAKMGEYIIKLLGGE